MNLFRLLKFLTIPFRVPYGTVSLLTYGPLAIGISATAITIGSTTIQRFGKSGQRFADPDTQFISDIVLGGLGIFAAMANPFDEISHLRSTNYSALDKSDEYNEEEKQDIKDFITNHADELGSDLKKIKQEIKDKLTPGQIQDLADNKAKLTPIEVKKPEDIETVLKKQNIDPKDINNALKSHSPALNKSPIKLSPDNNNTKDTKTTPSDKPHQKLSAHPPFKDNQLVK